MNPLIKEVLRADLMTFIEASFGELNPNTDFQCNWHIEKMAEALTDCRLGKIRRLIINVPPRSLKSISATVAFPAWLLGHDPSAQIICVSYGQDLANSHASDTRRVMESQMYRDVFPTRISPQKRSVEEFKTTQNGMRLATSVGGALTGRGADFIILDDPQKPEDTLSEALRKSSNGWYDHTLVSRLNNKLKGCIIIVMQRLHEDDLVGHVLQHGEWTVLSFPSIAEVEEHHRIRMFDGSVKNILRKVGDVLHPERDPREVIEERRKSMGTYYFSGQYQQSPAPFGGGMIKVDWFKKYKAENRPDPFETIYQSWDTANKASDSHDYSVCTTWGLHRKNLYLLNVLRQRWEYPELKRRVIQHARDYSAKIVLIEDQASGTQLIQDLRRDGLGSVKGYKSTLDKASRAMTVTSTIEAGLVHLPEEAHWLTDFFHELSSFPKGRFDDQVDSMSQLLDFVKSRSNYQYGLVGYYKRLEEQAQVKRPGPYPDWTPKQ